MTRLCPGCNEPLSSAPDGARCDGPWAHLALRRAYDEVDALRRVIEPQADETGESFALSVRGVMALLMRAERARSAQLRSLAQRVVDAQYPGGTEQPAVAVAISQLSGWLNDNQEAT